MCIGFTCHFHCHLDPRNIESGQRLTGNDRSDLCGLLVAFHERPVLSLLFLRPLINDLVSVFKYVTHNF